MDKYIVESLLFVRGWYEQAKEFINKLIIMQISLSLGFVFLPEDKCFSIRSDFHRPDESLATKHRTHTNLWSRTCSAFLRLQENLPVTSGNSIQVSLCLALFCKMESSCFQELHLLFITLFCNYYVVTLIDIQCQQIKYKGGQRLSYLISFSIMLELLIYYT